jgi:DNA-binding response OmpR family regulator
MTLMGSDGTGDRARILVVDDDEPTRLEVLAMLSESGWVGRGVPSGERAVEVLEQDSVALVILGAKSPDRSELDTLRQIRARAAIPVVLITGAASLDDRVAAFDLGADDYLVKPVEMAELQRRLRALLRRVPPSPEAYEAITGPAGLELRPHVQEALVAGRPVPLTPREFGVLSVLLQRRGAVVTPDEISRHVWGYETLGSRNFVEAHISRLRAKLSGHGAHEVITTVRGMGYRIR